MNLALSWRESARLTVLQVSSGRGHGHSQLRQVRRDDMLSASTRYAMHKHDPVHLARSHIARAQQSSCFSMMQIKR